MAISIGSIKSYKRPSSWTITPDDRQEQIEIIGGVHVQDEGVVAAGEKITCTAIFSAAAFATLEDYWQDRTKVTVIDESGTTRTNCRVVIKSYTYVERFPAFYTVTLEFWKV